MHNVCALELLSEKTDFRNVFIWKTHGMQKCFLVSKDSIFSNDLTLQMNY